MKHVCRILIAVFSLVVLTQCKTTAIKPANESDLQATQPASAALPRILIVVSGGWGSCNDTGSPVGSRTYDSAINLVETLQGQFDVKYVIACLDKQPPFRAGAKLSYMGSGIPLTSTRAVQFSYVVNTYIQQFAPSKTYFIGHSYGGWVVLDLLRQGVQANSVFTFDPIDARACLPAGQIFTPFGLSPAGCKRAPAMDYAQFIGNTAKLHNYWQDIGAIHSSPILEGNARVANKQQDVRNHPYFRGHESEYEEYTHRLIGAFAPVWVDVCQNIMSSNNGDSGRCNGINTDVSGHIVIQNPTAKYLQCSKSITDQSNGEQVTWLVYLDNLQSNGGILTATRGGQKLYVKDEQFRLPISSNQGNRVVFGQQGLSLKITLKNDGRTAKGEFYIDNSRGRRHVDDMFCVAYYGERADQNMESGIVPVGSAAATDGI